MTDIQSTIRKFFPAMGELETILHILYSKKDDNDYFEINPRLREDYGHVFSHLYNHGLITLDNKFTEKGLKKIEYFREVRGID